MLSNIMVRPLLMKERLVSGFNASRTVILTSKTGITVEERRFSKMQNWRHYLSKTCVKIKKNWHDHWEWQQAISKRLKAMGMIQKQGNWVPYEAERWTAFACAQLLERQRRKGFLHRIVNGDEKWIHYDNPKRRKSWGVPGFHVDGQTEYSRLQGHALYLVGPARRSILWTVKTDWNNHRRSVSNAIDAFESSIERQTAAIQRETR